MTLEASFLANKSILVTGVTGFVGKTVLESLLRDHSAHMATIYCLIRSKGKATPQQRLQEVLDSELFAQVDPRQKSNLVAIAGDMAAEGLGISEFDRTTLQDNLDLVIHMAASVAFDSPLLQAFKTNTVGAMELMHLAKACPRFQGLVHVSTAYVNTNLEPGLIEERLYPMPLGDPASLYNEMQTMDEHQATKFTETILATYPSTYIFVKALTEHILMAHGKVAIARLSTVTSTILDPIPGWSDGRMGANAAAIYVGLGILDSLVGRPEVTMDCVPVDYATNCILRIAHHLLTTNNSQIFHLASSTINPVQYGVFFDAVLKAWRQLPTLPSRIFPPDFHFVSTNTAHHERLKAIKQFKFHTLPKLISDPAYAKRLALAERKLDKFHANFDKYTTIQFQFQTTRTLALESPSTTITSSEVNSAHLQSLDWPKYFVDLVHGIHRFVLKEPQPK